MDNAPYWDHEKWPSCTVCKRKSIDMTFCQTCGIDICWQHGREHKYMYPGHKFC
jgi:transcription elongation factor Elf1